jgi:hypothetical protein
MVIRRRVPASQVEALLPVGGTAQQPFRKGPYPQSGRSPVLIRRACLLRRRKLCFLWAEPRLKLKILNLNLYDLN